MADAPIMALGEVAALVRERSRPAPEIVLPVVAQVLERLVPADLVAWNDVDLDAWRTDVHGFPAGRRTEQSAVQQVLATAADNPMVRSYLAPGRWLDDRPRRLSDLVCDADLHRTRAYAAVLKPLGGEHQVTVLTSRYAGRHARAWGFNRAGSDFTDAEVERLRVVQPLLAIIEQVAEAPHRPEASGADRWGLTAREAEMLELVSEGLTADAIASVCGIRTRTVRKHLENAYAKLGCHDRVTAVLRFRGAVSVVDRRAAAPTSARVRAPQRVG